MAWEEDSDGLGGITPITENRTRKRIMKWKLSLYMGAIGFTCRNPRPSNTDPMAIIFDAHTEESDELENPYLLS